MPEKDVSRRANIITSHVVYKVKTDEMGIRELKARIRDERAEQAWKREEHQRLAEERQQLRAAEAIEKAKAKTLEAARVREYEEWLVKRKVRSRLLDASRAGCRRAQRMRLGRDHEDTVDTGSGH